MHSFTFSFRARSLLAERSFWAAILSFILVISLAVVIPHVTVRSVQRARRDRFFLEKVSWHAQFDIVLVGSSRIYRDLSPREMTRHLANYRIGNLGFSHGGLNPEIYRFAEGRLAPDGPRGIIVLGIEPTALNWTDNACYRQYKSIGLGDRFLTLRLGDILEEFSPLTVRESLAFIEGRLTDGPVTDEWIAETGWCASTCNDPGFFDREMARQRARRQAQKDVLCETMVQSLERQVERWTERGIVVIGFRPPTPPETRALEDQAFGFDEQQLIERFRGSGGIWVHVDNARYHFYDSSHIDKVSALRFSRDLAFAIQDLLENGSPR